MTRMEWGSKEHVAAIAAADEAAGNYHALPRYRLESWAMGRGLDVQQERAIEELGRRYAADRAKPWNSERHRKRLATSWVKGFCGLPCKYPAGYQRGGNWARPLVRAHEDGWNTHETLRALMNTPGDEA